jgi:hypothetical protein
LFYYYYYYYFKHIIYVKKIHKKKSDDFFLNFYFFSPKFSFILFSFSKIFINKKNREFIIYLYIKFQIAITLPKLVQTKIDKKKKTFV